MDPNAHHFANMSYIAFLNRQQRMIKRGALVDGIEDDREGQSENNSKVSGGAASPDDKVTNGKQTVKPNQAGDFANAFGAAATETSPRNNPTGPFGLLEDPCSGKDYGQEFLKNEIDSLIKMMQNKQQVGLRIQTFTS